MKGAGMLDGALDPLPTALRVLVVFVFQVLEPGGPSFFPGSTLGTIGIRISVHTLTRGLAPFAMKIVIRLPALGPAAAAILIVIVVFFVAYVVIDVPATLAGMLSLFVVSHPPLCR